MQEGLVGGQGFAVDASLIAAGVQKQHSRTPDGWAAREIDAYGLPGEPFPDVLLPHVATWIDAIGSSANGHVPDTAPISRPSR